MTARPHLGPISNNEPRSTIASMIFFMSYGRRRFSGYELEQRLLAPVGRVVPGPRGGISQTFCGM